MTFFAFVFVPISLASSIFGMNVQEINASGHSIWTFVLTSALFILACAFAWLVWRATRNWKAMWDNVHTKDVYIPGIWKKVQAVFAAFEDHSKTPQAAMLGLHVLPEARKVQGPEDTYASSRSK